MSAQTAQAAPKPTIPQLQAQLQQQNVESDAAIQKFDQSQTQLQQQQAKVNTLQQQIARQQADVNSKLDSVGEIANQQYADGAIDPTVQLLLSSSPTDYLTKASSLGQVSDNQAGQIQALQAAEKTLDGQKAQAEQSLRQIQATNKQLAANKAAVQQKVAQTQALLNSMTAQQQAAVARAQAAANAAANAAAAKASAGSSGSVNLGSSSAGNSVEAAAFAAAQTRLGSPYVWGATGPSSFDCSGLMQWAYAQAGVSIGRTTYDQINSGTAVSSTADLQVGDLIFFNDNSHVGMYAGNGMVLHAPHTGAVVRYESLDTIGTIYAMRHI
ncbi:C40 family peptidase [Streptacidiphilus fuscans]|uniref:C40 family peptidase n=1 Tax=Streptacidiphilus fuscans TaxID=2789292 RepID=UPI002E2CB0D4|nr:NlpC/P60 family protein [Streptacidiphilus fuscans]